MAFEGFKNFIHEREARIRTPEFQAAIDIEKQEFQEQLSDTKDSCVNFLYNGVVKKVLWGTVKEEAKSLFSSKYSMADSLTSTTGKVADASWAGVKAVGNILNATGKATKIGARYLLGK